MSSQIKEIRPTAGCAERYFQLLYAYSQLPYPYSRLGQMYGHRSKPGKFLIGKKTPLLPLCEAREIKTTPVLTPAAATKASFLVLSVWPFYVPGLSVSIRKRGWKNPISLL